VIQSAAFAVPTTGEFICPEEWQRLPRAGSYGLVTWAACVRKSESAATWSDALEDCQQRHRAHLLVLDDKFYRRYVPTDVDERQELAESVAEVVVTQLRQFAADNGTYRFTGVLLFN
jgi:hypothetical protein